MFSVVAATIIVVLVFIILAICLYHYISNYAFILEYIVGSWIDSGGNIVIIDIKDSGLLAVSFGAQVSGDDYEVMSGEYDYTISKLWLKQEYKIKFNRNVLIHIIPAEKKIHFIKKGKTFGVFYSAKLPVNE